MNEKRWKEYQSLWDTTKGGESALGARGQGKFLFHYFAKDKLVLTESIDEESNYRFSYGTNEEYDDDSGKLENFLPNEKPLDHQGTRIWIMDIRQDLKDELLDYKKFINYIAGTWWEIIRNRQATLVVNFDGVDRQVELPQLPKLQKEKVFNNVKISNLGKIKELKLEYCKEEVPEPFRGIAVQRGGMTVLRFPVAGEETIKNRIYGYCTFDEDLEMALKKVEFPNHFGFSPKRAWNHTKQYINSKLEEFVQEISPTKKKPVALSQDLVERAVRIVNDLVKEYAPELTTEAIGPDGGKKPVKHVKSKPPPPVRVDTFRGNARKLEYDESLITECELLNETGDGVEVSLLLEVKHEEGSMKFSAKYNFHLDEHLKKKVDVPLVDFDEGLDKAGEYEATAILTNSGGEELHRRTFTFYLHENPPPPKGKVFLSTMVFSNGKGTPLEKKKHLPVNEKGVLRVIYDHMDFLHVRTVANSVSKKTLKQEMLVYIIKCGIEEAVQKLLEFRFNEGQLDPEEMRAIKDKCDAMCYDAMLSPIL